MVKYNTCFIFLFQVRYSHNCIHHSAQNVLKTKYTLHVSNKIGHYCLSDELTTPIIPLYIKFKIANSERVCVRRIIRSPRVYTNICLYHTMCTHMAVYKMLLSSTRFDHRELYFSKMFCILLERYSYQANV